MTAEAAELDKTIAAGAAPDAPVPDAQALLRRMHFKKRLIVFGGLGLIVLLVLLLVGLGVWKLTSRSKEAPAPEAAPVEVPKAEPAKLSGNQSGPLDVRPPLPDIRPNLHLLPPDQVFHAPPAGEAQAAQPAVPASEAPAPPQPAESRVVEKTPPAKAETPPAPGKPAMAEKPVEKAPEAPVSIFVTRKDKKAVGDCTVEAKKGADQKELRTQGLSECIRAFNEADRRGK